MQQSTKSKDFLSYYKSHLPELFSKLLESNLSFCIVGGAVRDYYHLGSYSNDIDIEVYSKDGDFINNWLKFVNDNFQKSLAKFNVLKLKMGDFSIEFAPAREEIHNESIRHDNFNAVFIDNEDKKKSFARRDFSINAIAIDISTGDVLDPFNGIKDIQHKILRSINKNFFKDPVRLLRLIRFSVNLKFKIHKETAALLPFFDLQGLTEHHFHYEFNKTDCSPVFLSLLKDIISKHEINFKVTIPDIKDHGEFSLYFPTLSTDQIKFFRINTKNYRLLQLCINMKINNDDDSFSYFRCLKKLKNMNSKLFMYYKDFEADASKCKLFRYLDYKVDFDISNVPQRDRERYIFNEIKDSNK